MFSRRTIKLSLPDLPKYRDITAKGISVRRVIYRLAGSLRNCRWIEDVVNAPLVTIANVTRGMIYRWQIDKRQGLGVFLIAK